jgi:toxin ParE1/3/4
VADVHVSRAARNDLLAIDDYGIDEFGVAAADALSASFRRAFVRLGEYPRSAPERSDFGKGIRCKTHRGYRVLYQIEGGGILILRILHHSRDVRKAMHE